MSKGEKRMRRALVSLGAKEKPGGKIEHSSESAAYVVAVIVAMVIFAILAALVNS